MSETDGGRFVDAETLQTLREMGDDDSFVAEVIDLFLRDAPSQLESLRSGVESGNTSSVRSTAHALKSACGNVGATLMARSADALEKLARAESLEGAATMVETLREQYERTRVELERAKSGLAP